MNGTDRIDIVAAVLNDGFSLSDLNWIQSHLVGTVSYEEYLSVLHDERAKGKPVEQIKKENQIPLAYAEAKDGTLVRGNENYLVESAPVAIATDAKGKPLNTVANFLEIMRHDPHYDGLRFNVTTNRADYTTTDENGAPCVKPWDDASEAASRYYCEKQYGLYHNQKHLDALRNLWKERHYNPIQDMLNALPPWDGVERCKDFLQTWMKAENTAYTRIVGQIMFDGAVARAFSPGCKFDLAVVLIGERSGEGKSTLVRLLAMNDEYFGEIQSMGRDPDKIYEDMMGKWIIEIGEYLMKDDQKEQDSTKAFITRLADTHRTPYDRWPVTNKRRCIFIGTTNHREFLTDPTGSRRWLPIVCHADGSFVGDDAEIKAQIKLCYAEALYRYRQGTAMLDLPKEIWNTARQMQETSIVEDERYGIIEEYCRLVQGKYICGLEIWIDALNMPRERYTMKPKREINELLRKMPFLVPEEKLQQTLHYGKQRVFRITLDESEN